MKKIFFVAVIFMLFAFVVSTALAEEANTPAKKRLLPSIKNIKEKVSSAVAEKLENRKEGTTGAKTLKVAENKERVRQSIVVRWNVFNRVVTRAENLLDKLQERITRAKDAGKDVTAAEAAMTDARGRLKDAKSKLENIKSKKAEVMTKDQFRAIHQDFKAIERDLIAIKKDAATIIRNLKSFNSTTSEGKNPQKEGTSSGEEGSASAVKD